MKKIGGSVDDDPIDGLYLCIIFIIGFVITICVKLRSLTNINTSTKNVLHCRKDT